jgi:hypothetical protein
MGDLSANFGIMKTDVDDVQASLRPNHNLLNRSKVMAKATIPSAPKSIKICSIEGCQNRHHSESFCAKHLYRWRKYGDPNYQPYATRICDVEGCTKRHYSHGFCIKHQRRWAKYGDPIYAWNDYGEGETFVERFWSRVAITANPEKCWNWIAGKIKGYGTLNMGGKPHKAHRVSYILTHGAISHNLLVRHVCDNPSCVNPNHLILGTNADNTRDKIERHRIKRGSTTRKSKLTEADIPIIRDQLKKGISQSVIAKQFKVERSTIKAIKLGITWTHVPINE